MGVMTVNTGHPMGHHLFMHGNRQPCFLVAFTADFVAVHFQQKGIFGRMRQMAGRAITNSHRSVNIGITKMTAKALVAEEAEFPWRPHQPHPGGKVMTILTFFFLIRTMLRNMTTSRLPTAAIFAGIPSQFRLSTLLIIVFQNFFRRNGTGNPIKDCCQDLMAGHRIASGKQQQPGR